MSISLLSSVINVCVNEIDMSLALFEEPLQQQQLVWTCAITFINLGNTTKIEAIEEINGSIFVPSKHSMPNDPLTTQSITRAKTTIAAFHC